jgi:Deacetylases, including yeast histone deacetylase and acetoin utilization protein
VISSGTLAHSAQSDAEGESVTCAWITHRDCRLHEMGEGHPECPERLDAISDTSCPPAS